MYTKDMKVKINGKLQGTPENPHNFVTTFHFSVDTIKGSTKPIINDFFEKSKHGFLWIEEKQPKMAMTFQNRLFSPVSMRVPGDTVAAGLIPLAVLKRFFFRQVFPQEIKWLKPGTYCLRYSHTQLNS